MNELMRKRISESISKQLDDLPQGCQLYVGFESFDNANDGFFVVGKILQGERVRVQVNFPIETYQIETWQGGAPALIETASSEIVRKLKMGIDHANLRESPKGTDQ